MNYQLEMDKIIEGLDTTPTLLIHSCCGPCSSYCLELLSKHFKVTVLWYNPNIHPRKEHDLRLLHQRKIIELMPFKNRVHILEIPYNTAEFIKMSKGFEEEREGGKRCEECFKLRMERTALIAKKKGFDYFTTTLTVSPHKNAPLINRIGFDFENKYGVKFLPCDFKKKNGYKRSIELSKEYDLYRQNYCGCVFSK